MSRFQGVILAAESSASLYPLTDQTQKPLLPIANKPLIAYALEKLLRFHITDIVVVLSSANRSEVENYVRRVFQTEKDRRARIVCFSSEDASQSSHALAQLYTRGLLSRDVLVMNSDVLSDCNLHGLLEAHLRGDNDITIAFHEHSDSALLLVQDPDSGHLLKLASVEELRSRGARFTPVLQRAHPKTVMMWRQDISNIFVLSQRTFPLIDHLASRSSNFAQEMLPCLVEHQFCSKLLRHAIGEPRRLTIRGFFFSGFIRQMRTPPDFLQLNIEAIRGLEQPGVFRASKNNARLPALVPTRSSTLFSEGCTIAAPELVLNSFVQETCKFGAGTKCVNSLVMRHSMIGDNCSIRNSIIGAFAQVGAGSVIVDSMLGDNLCLRENSVIEGETLAKTMSDQPRDD